MPKYLCLQRNLPTSGEKSSPSDMQAMYEKFNAWRETFADHLVDLGGKLGEGTVVHDASTVRDGPWVEVKELVGGYMIVEAESLEKAVEVAGACPGLVRPGSGCEVIEIHTP